MSVAGEQGDLGVYVHLPFCDRVCPYCDFAVEAVGRLHRERERGYVEALLRELDRLASPLGPRRLATVYLGGGTPSLFEPASVARLLDAIARHFPGTPAEVTLELNPGVLELGRVEGFRSAGVTRVSVGVQSLCDETLRRLGRAHRGWMARRGLEACLAAGFRSVSADLIVGAPGQDEGSLARDLQGVLDLGVAHVSTYLLTLEPGTPLARGAARGLLRLPDEETELRLWRLARGRLAAAGLEHYEVSSFARPGHRSLHNQRYWMRRDVLGLGASAASHIGSRRWRNLRDARAWEAAVRADRSTVEEAQPLAERDARQETLHLGLRRIEGVSRSDYRRRFGAAPEAHFSRELRELRALGLLIDEAGHLRLSERGLLFADEVALRFVGR
ncbi:MAG: radical SAM family heme chaperone HemW [Myxococcota bacterium]